MTNRWIKNGCFLVLIAGGLLATAEAKAFNSPVTIKDNTPENTVVITDGASTTTLTEDAVSDFSITLPAVHGVVNAQKFFLGETKSNTGPISDEVRCDAALAGDTALNCHFLSDLPDGGAAAFDIFNPATDIFRPESLNPNDAMIFQVVDVTSVVVAQINVASDPPRVPENVPALPVWAFALLGFALLGSGVYLMGSRQHSAAA
jgi:hypothetical protein